MMPIVDGLESEFVGEAAILRLTAAEPANVRLQQEYGLRGHPSFAVLSGDGRVLQVFIGPQTEETLRVALTTALND